MAKKNPKTIGSQKKRAARLPPMKPAKTRTVVALPRPKSGGTSGPVQQAPAEAKKYILG